MDRRQETRLIADVPATVLRLGSTEPPVPATIVNTSGQGLALRLDAGLPAGTAIRIDVEDAVLLGEVIYCRSGDTGCTAGVEIRHALYGVSQLAAVARSFIASR